MLESCDEFLGDHFFGGIEEVNSVFSTFVLEEDSSVVLLHSCTGSAPGKMAVNHYDFLVGWGNDFVELLLAFDSEKNLALGLGWHLF